jgi:hypothetical protein
MPEGKGTWPALWETAENNWPNLGEVDIVEGVNDVSPNAVTLHTSSGCTMPQSRTQTGTTKQTNCDANANGNAGCGVAVPGSNSYGPAFNANGGGYYVMERTASYIKVWFFTRSSAPSVVKSASQTIDTSTLGTASAYFPNTSCNIDSKFGPNNIIINLTLCGDWAGATFNSDTGISGTCAGVYDSLVSD